MPSSTTIAVRPTSDTRGRLPRKRRALLLERGTLPLLHCGELLVVHARHAGDIAIDDAHAVLADGAHAQLGLKGHTELAYDDDVEGCLQLLGDLERDGHAPPGQPEDHDIFVPEMAELDSQLPAGLPPITKCHGSPPPRPGPVSAATADDARANGPRERVVLVNCMVEPRISPPTHEDTHAVHFAVALGSSRRPLVVAGHLRVLPQVMSRGEMRRNDMTEGTVKWFNAAKGFGFITPDDGTPDVFAHYSAVEGSGYRELIEGQKVSFESEQGPKGPQAKTVRSI